MYPEMWRQNHRRYILLTNLQNGGRLFKPLPPFLPSGQAFLKMAFFFSYVRLPILSGVGQASAQNDFPSARI